MREDVPNEDAFLAGRRELGPVAGDRLVELDEAALGEDEHADRDQAFRAREDDRGGGLVPRPPALGVGRPTPHVDDRAPGDERRERAAALRALERLLESLRHPLEARFGRPLHPGRA